MANTATITKQNVSKVSKHGTLYQVGLNVVINDGSEDILSFSVLSTYDSSTMTINQLRDNRSLLLCLSCFGHVRTSTF